MTPASWLASLSLEQYTCTFTENYFGTMERIVDIWDDELVSILEVEPVGHRKRMLLSVAGPDGIKGRFGKVPGVGDALDGPKHVKVKVVWVQHCSYTHMNTCTTIIF